MVVLLVAVADGAVVDGDSYGSWGDEDDCNDDCFCLSSTSHIFYYLYYFIKFF